MSIASNRGLVADIWTSFRSQVLWVQLWMAFILVPANLASLAFLDQPLGGLVAFLAVIGMAPNVVIMFVERGFGKTMAIPHLLPWTALVLLILFARPEGSAAYATYLWIVLVVDVISLLFDYPESWQWLQERRARRRA